MLLFAFFIFLIATKRSQYYTSIGIKQFLPPLGMTPQRRDFAYPRVLVKSRSRTQLLEDLRGRQEELQAATAQCDTVEEEEDKTQLDQVHTHTGFMSIYYAMWCVVFRSLSQQI